MFKWRPAPLKGQPGQWRKALGKPVRTKLLEIGKRHITGQQRIEINTGAVWWIKGGDWAVREKT